MFSASLYTLIGFPGPMELIIVFAILLLLFGAHKIPEIVRSLGKGIKEFIKLRDEIRNGSKADTTNSSPKELETEESGHQKEEVK